MVDDKIDVQTKSGTVQHSRQCFQTVLRSVKRWPAGLAEIEAIVHIVADAKITLISPERRRHPHKTIPGKEEIGSSLLDGLIGRLEPLQNRGRRFVNRRPNFLCGLP